MRCSFVESSLRRACTFSVLLNMASLSSWPFSHGRSSPDKRAVLGCNEMHAGATETQSPALLGARDVQAPSGPQRPRPCTSKLLRLFERRFCTCARRTGSCPSAAEAATVKGRAKKSMSLADDGPQIFVLLKFSEQP